MIDIKEDQHAHSIFFDKKTGLRASVNEELAQELHKPVIKKFRITRVYSRFIDNIWAADLAEMSPLSPKKISPIIF